MKSEVVGVDEAVGKLLTTPIFQPSGKKLLAKGRLLSREDIRRLTEEGHCRVSVAVLEEQEIPEDLAARQLAEFAAGGEAEIQLAVGGRANVVATGDCCVLVNESRLRDLNLTGAASMATLPNFTFAAAGQRIATIKSPPFAVQRTAFESAKALFSDGRPALEARSIRRPTIAVLYSDPLRGERARGLFESIMRTRLERYRTYAAFVLSSVEEEEPLTRNLEHLLRARPSVILVASTTAPAGPEDVVGRAMRRAGCSIESFLAPVEPGNLLLIAYYGDIPVVAAPGCFRSPKPNAVDLVLPPLLAGCRLGPHEVATLGHGGLLQ